MCESAGYRQIDLIGIKQEKKKMLNRLMQVLPTALLDNLYDAIFPELVRRGSIQFPDDDD